MEQKLILILAIIFVLLSLYEVAKLDNKVKEKENIINQLKQEIQYRDYVTNDNINQ